VGGANADRRRNLTLDRFGLEGEDELRRARGDREVRRIGEGAEQALRMRELHVANEGAHGPADENVRGLEPEPRDLRHRARDRWARRGVEVDRSGYGRRRGLAGDRERRGGGAGAREGVIGQAGGSGSGRGTVRHRAAVDRYQSTWTALRGTFRDVVYAA